MFVRLITTDSGYYHITDTDFIENTIYPSNIYVACEVIAVVYTRRGLNEINAIEKYLGNFQNYFRRRILRNQLDSMSDVARSHFKAKYYRCIMHRMDKLDWIG